jgi:hypothetical protein
MGGYCIHKATMTLKPYFLVDYYQDKSLCEMSCHFICPMLCAFGPTLIPSET